MKIQTEKENLLIAIQVVQNIVSPRSTLPILSNILIETHNNTLSLTATDLDVGISCEIPVSTQEEGSITLPAKKFSDIIKELPKGNVVIVVKKNNLVDIECEKCRFKLMGLPKDEFPKLPEFKDKETLQVEQATLKEMLDLTAFAVSHEETRYILNGILVEVKENNLKLVATDGRRLAMAERKIATTSKKEFSVIIPIKAVNELNRNLKDDGKVAITLGTNQILFDINGVLIISRLIEGTFPNYKQVIPEETEKKVKLNREAFLAAIRRANLLSTPDFQAIKLEVFKNKMVVSKSTPDIGESREELDIEYQGKELIVGFNPHYLIDVLKNLTDEFLFFELSDADKPGVIRTSGYLYLVLPMRL
ncbi:MAG: DNA polymerase III subunit beta [Candidatus Omnitrophota bacterium]|nr:DNA polymerase III subunit beta [Candidatus Omnitrophota bacterium]